MKTDDTTPLIIVIGHNHVIKSNNKSSNKNGNNAIHENTSPITKNISNKMETVA